jgi:serine/threonine protein phosphatase 1
MAADTSGPNGDSPGRLLAIGDIHGCHIAFESLLERLEVTPSDTVVQLGDVIDRGPGTKQVIDRMIELQQRCRLVFLLGNHEEMFLETLTNSGIVADWLDFGGLETLASYSSDYGRIPADHLEFLRSGIDYWETESAVFVHATLDPDLPISGQNVQTLRWNKITKNERPLASGQRVICGHTAQKNGLPSVGDGWVCIDTFVYGGMFLTALDVTNNLVYQTQQTGEQRGPVLLSECETVWGSTDSG